MKLLISIIALVCSGAAFGAVPTDNALNEIVVAYRDAAASWEPVIRGYAYRLFWLLVAIDFSWGAIKVALEKSEFDGIVAFMVNRIMIIGFFLALISFGSTWSKTIIDSLRQLAGHAGGAPDINPSNILDLGLDVAVQMLNNISVLNLPLAIAGGLISIVILIVFALITAELIFVLVSMWVVLYAGIIMLALGGSEWTRSYAINYYRTVLAVGVKLFVIQLLVGIGISVLSRWTSLMDSDIGVKEMFVVAGGVLVLYSLVKGIGGLVESLVSGSGAATASGSGAMLAAGSAMAGAVAGMATGGAAAAQSALGTGQAASAASALASMKNEENGPSGVAQSIASLGGAVGGDTGRSVGQSLGGAFDKVAGTVKEAASAYGQDYSARASGDFSAQHGTTGGRMANIMADKIAESELGGDSSNEAGNYVSGVDVGAAEEVVPKKDE